MLRMGAGKNKRDTNQTGKISETAIIMRFLQLGYTVFTPFGGNQRYDLVVEDIEGEFWRIQCKSAWLEEGEVSIKFCTSIHNVTGKNRQPRNYRGECDYFAAYCEELNKVYLISVNEVGVANATLRLTLPKNRNQHGYRMAEDYEI